MTEDPQTSKRHLHGGIKPPVSVTGNINQLAHIAKTAHKHDSPRHGHMANFASASYNNIVSNTKRKLLWCSGISEPLPVAATFYMPDASGTTMENYARIDTMVCSVIADTSVNSKLT